MIRNFPLLLLLVLALQLSAQNISGVINIYTPVTAFNPCSNSATVGSTNGFAVGDEALLIEMKGAVVDSSDSATFGNILTYGDAGNYEFVHVASINGSNIGFVDRLVNQYDVNSLVQLIQVPQYANATVNGLLTCQAWNGTTGGVLALDVSGTLTLSANIDVSGLGFLGGAVSPNDATCNLQDYAFSAASGDGGLKGEGIATVSVNINAGRGNLANGGGGGDMQNAGGGGGGDYAAGGNGGDACQSCCGIAAASGGVGGTALDYVWSRLFLGGGGGGGQQNQGVGTPGGNGGGIIIIKGGQIVASAPVSISSNGVTAASISGGASDGEGGGGSAGIVALSVTSISGSAVTINAIGGNGGNNSAGADGPGGGGAGGGILLSNASLQSAITPSVTAGIAGYNYTTNSYQNAGPGMAGGIVTNLVLVAGTTPWHSIDTPVIAYNAPSCSGQTLQFTVSGTYIATDTFTWTGPNGFTSNLQNPSVTGVTFADSGTYTVVVNDSGCSTPPVSSDVAVYPVYTDTLNVALCTGASYVMPSGAVITTAGTYYDTLQTIHGCDSVIIAIVSAAQFNLVATGTTSICAGQSAQLNAIGGGLYTWAPSTGLSDSAIANPIATPASTTTYVVSTSLAFGNLVVNGDFSQGNMGFSSGYTYTPPPNTGEGQYWVSTNAGAWNGAMTSCPDTGNGSSNMMLVNGAPVANTPVWCETINVMPGMQYSFSAWVATMDAGSLAQLQVSVNGVFVDTPFTAPGNTCNWQTFGGGWLSGTATTADVCIYDLNTSVGSNDFALDNISFSPVCFASDSVTITVNPVYSDTVNAVTCQNEPYTLPGGTATTTNGTYIDTLQSIHGCDSVVTTNLTVNPIAQDTSFDTICQGASFTRPSGVQVNTGGVYIDTLTTRLGCDSIITTNLFVAPALVDTAFDTICRGGIFIRPSGITETQAGVYVDTLHTSGGCDSVIISMLTVNPTSATSVSDTICKGSGFTLPNGTVETTAGIYPVTLTNMYGCDSVVTTLLTVLNDSVSVNETDALCNGDSSGAIVAAATGGLSPYEYVLGANGIPVDSNASGNFQNQPAGTYSVTVTDNFGCTASANTIVNQPLPLQLTDTLIDVTCYGAHDGIITFSVTGGTGAYNFNLGGQTNTTGNFTGLDTGNFIYAITDAHNCFDTGSLTINQPQPVTIGIMPDSVVINLGQSIQLNATSNYDPATTYQWSPAIGLSCVQCPNPIAATNSTINYMVTVTANINGNDCDANTSILVTVVPDYDLYIPNVFAPGLNGPNNTFSVFGNLPAVAYFAIQIFDRWGERVYQSNDAYFQWDGTYKGKPLAQQVT